MSPSTVLLVREDYGLDLGTETRVGCSKEHPYSDPPWVRVDSSVTSPEEGPRVPVEPSLC